MITFEYFANTLHEYLTDIQYQREEYLLNQIVRYYETYRFIQPHLLKGKNILSIGAGSSYLEAFIASHHGVKVYIIDFPEVIELNSRHYENHNLKAIGSDFSVDAIDLPIDFFDIVLSLEVVEHVAMAPSQHYARFLPFLKEKAILFLSTPNLSCLDNTTAMLRGIPFMQTPELTFSPMNVKNEHIHRREYLPVEMVDSISKIGFKTIEMKYLTKAKKSGFKEIIKSLLFKIRPQLRPIFILKATYNNS